MKNNQSNVLYRDLTRVISILTTGPRTDMLRPGIKPGPPAWEASSLEKTHPDSLLIAIRNIYNI
jgi:hypothetical protein